MDDDEVKRETRVRYLHHHNYKDSSGTSKLEDVSIQNNGKIQGSQGGHKLTLASKDSSTILMETLENNVTVQLRLLNLNAKAIDPELFHSYRSVQRLEVGCPISVNWMFKYLSYMEKLTKVRFGRQAMCYEMSEVKLDNSTTKIRPSPAVQLLEISYDVEEYKGLSEEKKSQVNEKIKLVLQLAPVNFPALSECHLTIPLALEGNLDTFLSYFRRIEETGERRKHYSKGYVQFISSKVPRKKQDAHRSNKTEAVPKPKKHRDNPSNSSKSQSRSHSQSKNERSPSYSNSKKDFDRDRNRDPDNGASSPRAKKSRYDSLNLNHDDQNDEMRDPRRRKQEGRQQRVRQSLTDDDDVICLADSPTSSGIPADTDGLGHLQLPHIIIGGGGSDIAGGYIPPVGSYCSSYSFANSSNVHMNPNLHPNSNPYPTHHYQVPRGPNSIGSGTSSDLSRESQSRNGERCGSPSLLDNPPRSESPDYIRPHRHRSHR